MTSQKCPELGQGGQAFIQSHHQSLDTGFPGRGYDLWLHDSLQLRQTQKELRADSCLSAAYSVVGGKNSPFLRKNLGSTWHLLHKYLSFRQGISLYIFFSFSV